MKVTILVAVIGMSAAPAQAKPHCPWGYASSAAACQLLEDQARAKEDALDRAAEPPPPVPPKPLTAEQMQTFRDQADDVRKTFGYPLESPVGCVLNNVINNSPCKMTFSNGNTMDVVDKGGAFWFGLHGFADFKFETRVSALGRSSVFQTVVITHIDQAADIVQAPQREMLGIEGDCASRQYHVQTAAITDVNGLFTEDLGYEDFARRALPGTPMEALFNIMCDQRSFFKAIGILK